MERSRRELKTKLQNGMLDRDDNGIVLSKSLLELRGVDKSKVSSVFKKLLDNGNDAGTKFLMADSLEQIIALVDGDEEIGETLWNAKNDYNVMFIGTHLGLRSIERLDLKEAPAFKEAEIFRSNENAFNFIEPFDFEEMLGDIDTSMQARQIRALYCVGPLGSGTTRCGIELVKKAAADHSSKVTWIRGHVSAKLLPHCTKQDTQGSRNRTTVLELALCYGFGLQPHKAVCYNTDWREIRDKLQADLNVKEVRVLLHVDDFEQNPYAAQMLTEACDSFWKGNSDDLLVVPVITGAPSKEIKHCRGYYVLKPLPTDKLSNAFADRIGMQQDLLGRCPHLNNLFTVCEGLPALFACLTSNALRLDESRLLRLRHHGILDIADARALYNELVNYMEDRYSLDEWRFVLFDKIPGLEKEDCKQILTNLLVDVSIGAYVRLSDPVAKNVNPQVTYQFIGASGLIRFGDTDGPRTAQIGMPMVAFSVMNRYLKVIDEDIFATNPFDTGFENHKQLALAGLQAAVKFKMRQRPDYPERDFLPFGAWFLRRGGLEVENSAEVCYNPALLAPDSCSVVRVDQLVNSKTVDAHKVKINQTEASNTGNKLASIGKTIPIEESETGGLSEGPGIDMREVSGEQSECAQNCTSIDSSSKSEIAIKSQVSASIEADLSQHRSKRFRAASEADDQVDFGGEITTEKDDSDTSFNTIDAEKDGEENQSAKNKDEGKSWIQVASCPAGEVGQSPELNDEAFKDLPQSESRIESGKPEGVKDNEDGIPQLAAGTILVSTVENEAVDAVTLFRGKLRDDTLCWVLMLSRSEWIQPVTSLGEKVVQGRSHSINDIIEKMISKKDEIIQKWFSHIPKNQIFVMLDIITNCESKDTLCEDDVDLPDDVSSCLITTLDNLEEVLRPTLGVRARMKWVME